MDELEVVDIRAKLHRAQEAKSEEALVEWVRKYADKVMDMLLELIA